MSNASDFFKKGGGGSDIYLPLANEEYATPNNKHLIPLTAANVNIDAANSTTGDRVVFRRATTDGTRPNITFVGGITALDGVLYGTAYGNQAVYNMTEEGDIEFYFDGQVWTEYPINPANEGLVLNTLYITTSGTFQVPAGVTEMTITAVGGGGGDGGGAGQGSSFSQSGSTEVVGGAGGGGAGTVTFTIEVVPFEVLTLTIGAGGARGDYVFAQASSVNGISGGNGGSTTFVSSSITATALGGSGGVRGRITSPGNYKGGSGGSGQSGSIVGTTISELITQGANGQSAPNSTIDGSSSGPTYNGGKSFYDDGFGKGGNNNHATGNNNGTSGLIKLEW